VSRPQLRELAIAVRTANPTAIIAIDEEGGDVTRLYYDVGSPYPGAAVLGRLDDLDTTRKAGARVGRDLAAFGVNLDLAPVADVNSNPDNPVIGVRSFGSDPDHAALHTAAWTEGLQSTGVAACAKHFPGHGDTAQDSHLALPVVDRPLDGVRERELVPFRAAIAAGTRTVMTSHILLPRLDSVPATFSRVVLDDLLRGELGFDGVVVSDALDMAGASGETGIPEAAVRALAAGCDLLCIGTGNTDEELDGIERAIAEAVGSGRLDPDRLDDATRRVRELALAIAPAQASGPDPAADTDRDPDPADLDRTAASFDVAAGIAEPDPGAELWPVCIETTANAAIGVVPWGPFTPDGWRPGQVLQEGDLLHEPPAGATLWLVGRDLHRHAWVRAVVDDARARFAGTVVVDMGWPSADRVYADIATFGASRHVGLALQRFAASRYGVPA